MKYTKPLIRITLSVIILGLLGWFIASKWEGFAALSIERPYAIVLVVPLVLLSLRSAGMVNELTMEPHGVILKKREVFALAGVTRFFNQIAPNYVGAAVRGTYFKKQHGVSITKFSSSFAVANLLQITISLLISTSLYLIVSAGQSTIENMLFALGLAAALLFITAFPTKPLLALSASLRRLNSKAVAKHAGNLITEYCKVRSHPNLLIKMVSWMTTLILIFGCIIYLLFYALGYGLTGAEALFIAAMTNLSVLLSVTPAGLGIREGMLAFAASLIGAPIITAVAVALLLRLVMTLTTGLVTLVFYKTLTRSS